ncbi:RNA polymerase subunit sigma-24 [Candidatus Wolfebacteria bacterium CG_4_9_14_0_8_um_filter_39_46]|uniref:RNA polymerase subunit sigma-24 n=1 Tax=Candidatus Wolfebacteria bacterium CG_4_9_14_0_8_um_filter_39_46 TaxID=1975064 RepID=A0A2M8D9H4_9BACT|nr:MAG: RNA polymerase subunit sigma-24 [Candidatus Wolfebacteria bacterium CG_4_9_14_0_8_um_filter_39_46]
MLGNQFTFHSFSMIDGEKNLIERAIKGEAEAFGLLYDRYQPQIYRFVYLKVGHREEAEDLTHQVFLKSWQNITEYSFQGFPFSSWLYSVARHQVIDYYRTKKSNIALENIAELKIENPAPRTIDNNLDIERVKIAIHQLKDEQQDIIVLRFIEDLSLQEAASILNKTEGAVKLLQHRAIKNLKNILNLKS